MPIFGGGLQFPTNSPADFEPVVVAPVGGSQLEVASVYLYGNQIGFVRSINYDFATGSTESASLILSVGIDELFTQQAGTYSIRGILLDQNFSVTNGSTDSTLLGGSAYVFFIQDNIGGYTVSFDTRIRWSGGVAPVITPAANSISLIQFFAVHDTTGAGGSYALGVPTLNF